MARATLNVRLPAGNFLRSQRLLENLRYALGPDVFQLLFARVYVFLRNVLTRIPRLHVEEEDDLCRKLLLDDERAPVRGNNDLAGFLIELLERAHEHCQ